MSSNSVEKGLQFEKAVVDMLNNCGFKAWRTNQSNEADPENIKLDLMVVWISLQHLMLLNQSVEMYVSIFNVNVTKNH